MEEQCNNITIYDLILGLFVLESDGLCFSVKFLSDWLGVCVVFALSNSRNQSFNSSYSSISRVI